MIGLKGSYELWKPTKYLTVKTNGEADWGPAIGYNIDHHRLRGGDRITVEKTSGNAAYFSLGLDLEVWKTVTAGIKMDYLRINTYGTHTMTNVPQHVDETWSDGVRVWSDQTSITVHLSYSF